MASYNGGTEPTGTEHALTVCTPICQILLRLWSLQVNAPAHGSSGVSRRKLGRKSDPADLG